METALVVSSVLLWLVILLNMVLTLALVRRINTKRSDKSASPEVLKTGQLAPDFTAQTLNGETVTLSTYAGRKVAFVFIETSCGPCQEFVPQLEFLKPQAARAGVEIALVSGNDMEDTLSFIEQLHVSLPVLVAPRRTNPFFEAYKSTFTPSYCFVDQQGIVQSAGPPNQPGGSWEALAESWMQKDALVTSERR